MSQRSCRIGEGEAVKRKRIYQITGAAAAVLLIAGILDLGNKAGGAGATTAAAPPDVQVATVE